VLAGALAPILAFALVWAAASWSYGAVDARKAHMTTSGPYHARLASLEAHPVPEWFADAKFGVFVHWGLFSVPGFAPKEPYADVLRDDYDRAMVRSPYAEDYANAMRDPSSPTADYHRKTYGDMPYEGFQQIFEREVADFDADEWAKTFQRAGADYVVMVAKYHDGYSLWPTKVRNPHAPGWHSDRDLVGEVANAVRARGMRFGVYYSGGVDWTFQRLLVETLGDYSYLPYGDGYDDYAEAQVRELVERYRPDVLWNDISWPTGQQRLNAMFADYYNTVPDGVVNDRWQTDSLFRWLMGLPPARGTFDLFLKQVIARDPGVVDDVTPPAVPHADFTTPSTPSTRPLGPSPGRPREAWVPPTDTTGRRPTPTTPRSSRPCSPTSSRRCPRRPAAAERRPRRRSWADPTRAAPPAGGVRGLARRQRRSGARHASVRRRRGEDRRRPARLVHPGPRPGQRRRRRAADGLNGPDPGRGAARSAWAPAQRRQHGDREALRRVDVADLRPRPRRHLRSRRRRPDGLSILWRGSQGRA
jgi:hypothetical protein